jgi:hypothetical protein
MIGDKADQNMGPKNQKVFDGPVVVWLTYLLSIFFEEPLCRERELSLKEK